MNTPLPENAAAPASFISRPQELPPVPLPPDPSDPPSPPDPITAMTALELSAAIHARTVSCREVMQAYLTRIDRHNPAYNALVALQDHEISLAQADQYDRELTDGNSRGWLHGIPQAPKDLSNAIGFVTSNGSPIFASQRATIDSLNVARARAEGAIIIGKSNTPEFGLGSQTFNEVYGATRNALNPALTAGGSSGGAATALALNLLPVADGSDMMGSLRNPAAFNGIYGFRPSFGRVPSFPVADVFVQQLGVEGPMGRTPQDCARLLATQAGADPRSPLSLPGDGAGFLAIANLSAGQLSDKPLAGKTIGWLGDLDGYLATDPGLLDMIAGTLGRLESLGARIEPITLGINPERLWHCWLTLRQGLQGGKLAPLNNNPETRSQLKPEARWEAEQAAKASAADFFAASTERTAWFQAALKLFEKVNFLASPTAQVFPFDLATRWPREINGRPMDTYHRWMESTIPATLGGLPAISIPAGDQRLSPFGHSPISPRAIAGLQLIGGPQDDASVLTAAVAIHESR